MVRSNSTVMAKKLEGKRLEGWVYMVQWGNDKDHVKIGYTTSLKDRLSSFLTYCCKPLIVIKAFRANQKEEAHLHEQFASCRVNGEWFSLSPTLRHYIREQSPCQTKEARLVFEAEAGEFYKDRILWKPMQVSPYRRMTNAYNMDQVPPFIKTANSFVLWVINELEEEDYYTTPNAIIKHKANANLYEAKTIYNALAILLKNNVIRRGEDKLYYLTDRGRRGLCLLEGGTAHELPPRKKNARSLKPSASLA